MPQSLTSYRVFLASPGGLEVERKRFRETLEEYNEGEAIPRGVHFCPVGWEVTLGGVGRPQELINEEILSCDYFALLLHDRWGSSPLPANVPQEFTSGTEEEYHVATSCRQDANRPMRDVLLLFKGVSPERMSDPGEQLKKVLAFRKQIQAGKEHLFETFDEPDEFQRCLRRHLAKWTRDHESERKG